MAIEDQARNSRQAASVAQTRVNDQRNKAITQGKLIVIEQIVNGLPAPVNFAAKALGEGLHAAFKITPDAVLQPASPTQDPLKLMAYAMAFAILKAIWCFIKSILNPLPIIGFFFSLCSDDAQLTGVVVRNIAPEQRTLDEKEKIKADNDPENRTLTRSVGDFASRAGTGTIVGSSALQQAENTLREKQSALQVVSADSMTSGPTGITFDEFVALTANASPDGTIVDSNAATALQSQTNQASTSADVPATPVVSPEWKPSEALTYQEARKLFGL